MAIPKHLRNLTWKTYNGSNFRAKCWVSWCPIVLECLSSDWHVGHNKPFSEGGKNCIANFRPICSGCNYGMGNRVTIDEWERYFENPSAEVIAGWTLLSLKDLKVTSTTRKRSRSETDIYPPTKKLKIE